MGLSPLIDHLVIRPENARVRPNVMRTNEGVTVYDWTRPRSINREMADRHWSIRANQRNEDRQRWGWLWRMAKLPAMTCVEIVATAGYRRSPQDTGNCIPTVKAAVDALQDVGVIPDDGPEVVRLLAFRVDLESTADYLALLVRDVSTQDASHAGGDGRRAPGTLSR